MSWNYFLLPQTIPYILFQFLQPIGVNPFILIILLNGLFIVLLSLLFIYPNKVIVDVFQFKKEKDKKRMFWICQLISVITVIFIKQAYEIIVSFI